MKKTPQCCQMAHHRGGLMGWMLVAVNDRASRVKMPEPDNSLGVYRSADA